jgi:ATP-dependent RNA helicase DeaD
MLKDDAAAPRFTEAAHAPRDFHDRRDPRDNSRGPRENTRFGGDRDDDRRRKTRRDDSEMETFRIEVGRENQVQPGNIVGAIANETGIDSSFIGRIEIRDTHTLVDLPLGMPPEMFTQLKKVWVAGCQLNISRLNDPRPEASTEERPARKPPFKAKDKDRSKFKEKPRKKKKVRAKA